MSFIRAVYDLLAQDSTLLALLPDYQQGKALFRGPFAPGDTPHPFVIVRYVSQVPVPNFREPGGQVLIDVAVYDESDHGTDKIEAIHQRVIELLGRGRIQPAGFHEGTISEATSMATPYERGVVGRVATFEAQALRI